MPDRKFPNSVFLYEVYDDEAAFETHKLTLHYGAFNQAIGGMIVSKSIRLLHRTDKIGEPEPFTIGVKTIEGRLMYDLTGKIALVIKGWAC